MNTGSNYQKSSPNREKIIGGKKGAAKQAPLMRAKNRGRLNGSAWNHRVGIPPSSDTGRYYAHKRDLFLCF